MSPNDLPDETMVSMCATRILGKKRRSRWQRSGPMDGEKIKPALTAKEWRTIVIIHDAEPEPGYLAMQGGLGSGGGRTIPVALGGSGKVKSTRLREIGYQDRAGLDRALRVQGLPADFLDDSPFTMVGKHKAIGNGVPLPMGRAVARAVKKAMGYELATSVITALENEK